MRFMRIALSIASLLLSVSAWAQTPPLVTQTDSSVPPARTLDPQAVAVLNQVLQITGGSDLVRTIKDCTATGNITYHWAGQDVQGSVTLTGKGSSEFRMDSSLPTGTRTITASKGITAQKNEDGSLSRPNPATSLAPGTIIFPYSFLLTALNAPVLNVFYKGLAQVDGHSAHQIRIQPVLPEKVHDPNGHIATRTAMDFYIDASSYQLLMIQNMVYSPGSSTPYPRQIHFSDFRQVNGLLMPFSVSETLGGQHTWEVSLNNTSFNSGLTDINFELSK